ncbi:hypothetical protein [Deferribacter desulfuricans]|uniref:hypothetical protein n=1 Tax=Deferribacter desulfuricans TaxID=197162 RepID=UPI0002D58FCB|nr:hypothetical protein [Deferribacter desulfuricans]
MDKDIYKERFSYIIKEIKENKVNMLESTKNELKKFLPDDFYITLEKQNGFEDILNTVYSILINYIEQDIDSIVEYTDNMDM